MVVTSFCLHCVTLLRVGNVEESEIRTYIACTHLDNVDGNIKVSSSYAGCGNLGIMKVIVALLVTAKPMTLSHKDSHSFKCIQLAVRLKL